MVLKSAASTSLQDAYTHPWHKGRAVQRHQHPLHAVRNDPAFACCAQNLAIVGSINVDMAVSVDRVPGPGETLAASKLERFAGGKRRREQALQGANQAAAAALLSCETLMVGQTGEDADGEFMLEALQNAGVRTDGTVETVADTPTGKAIVMLQPGGENSIIIVGGANTADWTCEGAQRKAVEEAGMLLMQRELTDETNEKFAAAARNAGVPVVLDAGGAEGDIAGALLECITLFSPNESELARITGMSTSTMDEVAAAVKKVQRRAGCDVLVKLGSNGSILYTDSDTVSANALKAETVVDTTGAGDCFTAAYAVGCLEGKGPQDALKFAAAAASICVQHSGAMPSLPRRDSVDALLYQ